MGKLYVADGRPREALKCYFNLHDADTAMALIKDHHLVDAISDDIPGLILLRVSKEQAKSASSKSNSLNPLDLAFRVTLYFKQRLTRLK